MEKTEATETTTLRFYGASDDLVEVGGDAPGCDEYSSEREVFVVAGLRIAVEYGARGCWGIGVEQVDEDVLVTASNMRLSVPWRDEGTQGYSMLLEMDVPVGTVVVREATDAT